VSGVAPPGADEAETFIAQLSRLLGLLQDD
jgi:hypothetical protein